MTLFRALARKPAEMTIPLRVPVCLLAALVLAGCQAPAPSTSTNPTPSRPPSPPAVRAFTTCFTAAPATWAGTQRASLPTTQLDVQAVTPAGDRAFASYLTVAGEQGIAAIDLATGALTRVVTSGGGASLAVDPPWLAWVRPASAANPDAWTLEARNLDTGEQLTVATPTPDAMGQPGVVLRAGRVAWVQPTTKGGQPRRAEVRVYDLATRSQTILDSGDVGSPFLAGRYLLWGHAGDGLRAVDGTTLQAADLPARVRSQVSQSSGGSAAGSPEYLVWTGDEHAFAWRIDRDQLSTYAITDLNNRLQFLTVAGHYLIWFTSNQYAVLDLDTGGGYDFALPGSITGSDAAIVRTTSLGGSPKGAGPGTVVSVLPTASAPAIPACGG